MLITRKKLLEDGEAAVDSAASTETGNTFGGVTAPFQTPYNTIGVGNPVPPHGNMPGSGDLIDEYIDKIKNKHTRIKKKLKIEK